MDSSNVLLALEEQNKWRERLQRVQERIRQLDRRKATLAKELDRVRKKIADYNRILAGLKETMLERPAPTPLVPGRR